MFSYPSFATQYYYESTLCSGLSKEIVKTEVMPRAYSKGWLHPALQWLQGRYCLEFSGPLHVELIWYINVLASRENDL